MATLNFVQALITLWNRQEADRRGPELIYHGRRSIEGFKEFMKGQTVTTINDETFYYYEDVSRYLHGQEVIDEKISLV